MVFLPSPYDPCGFKKIGSGGAQATGIMYVNHLFVSRKSNADIDKLENYMPGVYKEIKVSKGKVLDYLGMTFDYVVPGQVSIAMDNYEQEILS
jgi:hypothetical protein